MSGTIRCAIYTRKSTDEGLEQPFNSLDAQREACEAYVRSQAGEGWKALPTHYDDGGYSGGNLDRPAMQRLLSGIDVGEVDVIVVYKVDRLTRSLMDFAKIVERLDARGVSFVSVTQAFNTTTSMGRLTLNVLLSFAQFEREVTGERIRDKIAASKAKGMWMGGNVPFGYDLGDRRLVVNPAEADQVRHIFTRYRELGSGVQLMHELRRDEIVSKQRVSRSGKASGGVPFSCGALYHLLQNRIYVGEITHLGVRYAGDHEAIIDIELFDEVQKALAVNRQNRRQHKGRTEQCILAGLVRDAAGQVMTTSFSYGRGGRLYRYYVSGSLDPARPKSPSSVWRVPAAPLERLVLQALTGLLRTNATLTNLLPLIATIELWERSIQVAFRDSALAEPHEPIDRAAGRLAPFVGENRLVSDRGQLKLIIDRQAVFLGGLKSETDGCTLPERAQGIAMLRAAHTLLETHCLSPLRTEDCRKATVPKWQRQRRTMMLGLLAPQLQKAILQGKADLPADATLAKLPPLAWIDQVGRLQC